MQSIIKLRSEFPLYLSAIKEAIESGDFSSDDQLTLKRLFEQGLLYSSILAHENLCSEGTLDRITAFCALLEQEFPAPNLDRVSALSFQLAVTISRSPTASVSQKLSQKTEALHSMVMAELMSVFHMAIFDLSYRLNNTAELTQVDQDNAKYVIGMSEITVGNLEMAVAKCGQLAAFDYEPIHKFFVDGSRFAASLKSAGAGIGT